MLKHYFVYVVFFLVTLSLCSAQTNSYPTDASSKDVGDKENLATIIVRSYVHHISDIDIRDQQYNVEIWLLLMTKDNIKDWDKLPDQFQVKGAKKMCVTVVPMYPSSITSGSCWSHSSKTRHRKLIKINCTMAQDWDVDNYPFDKQNLQIICYTARSRDSMLLVPDRCDIEYNNEGDGPAGNIENGWFVARDCVFVDTTSQKDITRSTHSAIRYSMQISRKDPFPLFFKLFIGMYVSFFVAFIALFIDVTHVEPRFGLPVGGLFAAIGNKYIMESILPPTSQFTIVDALHIYTIVAILLMIVFSAISLKLAGGYLPSNDRLSARFPLRVKQMKWIDKNGTKFLLWGYVAINALSVFWAIIHER